MKEVFYQLKNRSVIFFILLIFSFITSVLEATGFAMILPLLESGLQVNTESPLSKFIRDFFVFFGFVPSIVHVSGLFVLLITLKGLFTVVTAYLKSFVTSSYRRDAIVEINRSLLTCDYNYFVSQKQGHLISDAITLSQNATLFLFQLVEFLTSIFGIVILILVMFAADVEIASIVLSVGFAYFLINSFFLARYGKKVGLEEVELNNLATDFFSESINSMRQFRINNLADYQLHRLYSVLDSLKKLEVKWSAITAAMFPLVEFIIALILTLYLIFLDETGNINEFSIKLPVIALMMVLTHRLLGKLTSVNRTQVSLIRYYSSLRSINKYKNFPKSYLRNASELAQFVEHAKGVIDFDSVTVLNSNNNKILDDVSFTIPPGKIIGFTGKSGAGKSSLLDAIVGLRNISDGTILINDIDVKKFNQKDIFRHIGIVSQSVTLINSTVMDNIKMGNLSSSDQEVYELTKALAIHDFILSLPDGYETHVGNNGGFISGGQAQRLNIARALLSNPSILILDEFTSALDRDTEISIIENVLNIMRGKTVIISGHRSIISNYCDATFEIKNNKVLRVK